MEKRNSIERDGTAAEIDPKIRELALSPYYERTIRDVGKVVVPYLTVENQFAHYEELMSIPNVVLAASAKISDAASVLDVDVAADLFPGGSYESLREAVMRFPKLRKACMDALGDDFDSRLSLAGG